MKVEIAGTYLPYGIPDYSGDFFEGKSLASRFEEYIPRWREKLDAVQPKLDTDQRQAITKILALVEDQATGLDESGRSLFEKAAKELHVPRRTFMDRLCAVGAIINGVSTTYFMNCIKPPLRVHRRRRGD